MSQAESALYDTFKILDFDKNHVIDFGEGLLGIAAGLGISGFIALFWAAFIHRGEQ